MQFMQRAKQQMTVLRVLDEADGPLSARTGELDEYASKSTRMLFDGQPEREWGDAPRRNQLVFIGRNLDEQSMRQGFEACLI